MLLVFDFGNARGKVFVPRANLHFDFLHAVAQLTNSDWSAVVGRGKPPRGFVKVNGVPYVVGDSARRYTIQDKPKGAARYNELYYGAGLAYAMVEGIPAQPGKTAHVSLYASYAPQDQAYVPNLIRAAKQTWKIECTHGLLEYEVRGVRTFDEPLGGYAHFTLTEDGTEKRRNSVINKTALVIDVGGYTADQAIIDPGGMIDPLSVKSRRVGTIEALQTFERELRNYYRKHFQDAGDLDVSRVEQALITGSYPFGKLQLDCADLAKQIIQSLANDVIQIIKAAGGAANFDVVLLTGGGSALIYDALVVSFPQIEFVMVETDRALLKYANVFGGAKIAAMMAKVSA